MRTFSADAPLYKDKLDVDWDSSALEEQILSPIEAPLLDCLHVVFQDSAFEKNQR